MSVILGGEIYKYKDRLMKASIIIILISIIILCTTGCDEKEVNNTDNDKYCADLWLYASYKAENIDDISGEILIKEMVLISKDTKDTLSLGHDSDRDRDIKLYYMEPIIPLITIPVLEKEYNKIEIMYDQNSYFNHNNERIPARPAENKYHQTIIIDEPLNDCYPYTLMFNIHTEIDSVTETLVYVFDTYLDDDYEGLNIK